MIINRKNYEPYFIDLLDGTLSNEMVDELLDFLRLNPDLAEELKSMETIHLQPEILPKFDHRSLLKSGYDQPDIFNETCIRYIENELSVEEEKQFQTYLSNHTQAETEYNLFRATILEPDLLMVYPDKNKLKHRVKIMLVWYAAAAVVLLGVVFWFNLPQNPTTETVVQSVPVINEPPSVAIEMAPLKDSFVKVENTETAPISKETKPVQIALNRNDEKIEPLQTNLSVSAFQNKSYSDFTLAAVSAKPKLDIPDYYPTVPEIIVEEVNKIDMKAEAKKVSHFALNKLKDITDDKLNFATKQNGKIRKIEYNSRLLAFSIPVNSGN